MHWIPDTDEHETWHKCTRYLTHLDGNPVKTFRKTVETRQKSDKRLWIRGAKKSWPAMNNDTTKGCT